MAASKVVNQVVKKPTSEMEAWISERWMDQLGGKEERRMEAPGSAPGLQIQQVKQRAQRARPTSERFGGFSGQRKGSVDDDEDEDEDDEDESRI